MDKVNFPALTFFRTPPLATSNPHVHIVFIFINPLWTVRHSRRKSSSIARRTEKGLFSSLLHAPKIKLLLHPRRKCNFVCQIDLRHILAGVDVHCDTRAHARNDNCQTPGLPLVGTVYCSSAFAGRIRHLYRPRTKLLGSPRVYCPSYRCFYKPRMPRILSRNYRPCANKSCVIQTRKKHNARRHFWPRWLIVDYTDASPRVRSYADNMRRTRPTRKSLKTV